MTLVMAASAFLVRLSAEQRRSAFSKPNKTSPQNHRQPHDLQAPKHADHTRNPPPDRPPPATTDTDRCLHLGLVTMAAPTPSCRCRCTSKNPHKYATVVLERVASLLIQDSQVEDFVIP
jgi:hypothetical protein